MYFSNLNQNSFIISVDHYYIFDHKYCIDPGIFFTFNVLCNMLNINTSLKPCLTLMNHCNLGPWLLKMKKKLLGNIP